MFSWLKRLLAPPAPPPPARAGRRQAGGSAVTQAPAAAAPPASSARGGPPPIAFGSRRPLVAAKGGVAGFEFLLPPGLEQRMAARSDPAVLAAHQSMLLAAMRSAVASGREALTTLPAAALSRPGLAEQASAGMLLLVPDLADLAPAIVAALRGRGVRLGIGDGPPQGAPEADFVVLQGGKGGLDTLLLSAQRWQEERPRLTLIATGLAGVDEVERLLRSGFWLVGGELGRTTKLEARPLNATAHRICELMNHLALDRDTAELAQAVRADVALSYRLLRFANSPAMGLSRGVDSVEQAVTLLGRKELTRWLGVMLLSAAGDRAVAAALQEQALARGRLLELLAQAEGMESPDALFSVGVFSMLEVLLQVPLAEALAPLRLSDEAAQAVLAGKGPWAEHLAVAVAMGAGDDAAIEKLAGRWGGVVSVYAMAEDAWAWAAELQAANAAK